MTKNFFTNVFQHGNHIYLRGYENGVRVQKKIKYEPSLFIPTEKNNTQWKSLDGQSLEQKKFNSIADAKSYIKSYGDILNIYGYDRWVYTFINEYYSESHHDLEHMNIVYIDIETDSRNGFPDIRKANEAILSIAMRRDNLKIVFGLKELNEDILNVYYIQCDNENDLLRRFLQKWNEFDIDVVTGWNSEFFDIPYLYRRITNVLGKPYADSLSPWNMVKEYSVHSVGRDQIAYDIQGISHLDYLAVYKKFQLKPRDSYKLDEIGFVELEQKKVDYSEYGTLAVLYEKDFRKFIEYNISDVDIVYNLEQRLGYLEQIFTLAHNSGVNYSDTLTTLTIWDTTIHNHLYRKNIAIPPRKKVRNRDTIVGGYVKNPIIGMHRWVVSFDLNSLYPHLIQQYNISPETNISLHEIQISNEDDENALSFVLNARLDDLVEKRVDTSILKRIHATMTANNQLYRHDVRGFLPELMEKMYNDRKTYKQKAIALKKEFAKNRDSKIEKEMRRYNNMQGALKVLLNSAYGAIANQYFRFYRREDAEAITMSGQLSIRWIERKMNEYLNRVLKTVNEDYIIAVDTDSIYISFDSLVNQVFQDIENVDSNKIVDFLDKISNENIRPYIDKCYNELCDYMNGYQQKMFMKRESIANKAIWTAKKRYILNVCDDEGVRNTEPELKMMGIEAIRSSTPSACRDYIKETLRLIMNTNEETVQKFIKKAREKFENEEIYRIAFPRGVNFSTTKTLSDGSTFESSWIDADNIYKKGTPIQVKAALIYNHLLEKMGLEKRYEKIRTGDKIKFVYLLKPNPTMNSVIAFLDRLPKEFGLEPYIDYETQFQKGFLDPITVILNAIGWKSEKKNDLMCFFS